MLSVRSSEVVLWVHVLAACVWIGGQVVVAAIVPMLRPVEGLAAAAGRRFQLVAWPAFLLLVATGVDNVRNAGITWGSLTTTDTGRTLSAKLGLVALSGAAAAVHAVVQAPRARRGGRPSPLLTAVLGSTSLLAAVAAALLGVVIAG
jgi:putative copper export protein